MLRPAVNLALDMGVLQSFAQYVDRFVDDFFADVPLLLHLVYQVVVFIGLQIAEGQVFQFPLDIENTEAMGQRREDFQRFLGDALLLVAAHVPQGPHVVQAVGQLDDDDPHVLGHGQEHLAHAVELLVFLGPVIETAQFRNAVDEEGYFLAEEIFKSSSV